MTACYEHWLHKFVLNLLTHVIPAWFHSAPQSFLWCHRMIRSLSLKVCLRCDLDRWGQRRGHLFPVRLLNQPCSGGWRWQVGSLPPWVKHQGEVELSRQLPHTPQLKHCNHECSFFLDYRVFCPHREHGGCFYQPLLKMFSSKRDKNVPFECVLQALS